jgi:4-amino-4-deoxy-L-arabinose transferase-like glycosyltransferase
MVRRSLPLILIFALAVGVRWAFIPDTPGPQYTTPMIGAFAHNIVSHGRWFVFNETSFNRLEALETQRHRLIDPAEVNYSALEAPAHWRPFTNQPIGPPLVLAAIWELTGDQRYVYGLAFQILLDSLVALLVYRIALQLFARRRAALIAATLYAVFPPIAQQTTFIGNDLWGIDFSIAILAAYMQALRSPRRWSWLVLCGVLTGVGAYFRPNLILLPAVLALATIPWAGWREPARGAVLATAVAVLSILPWTIHNYIEYHQFVAMRSGLGVTLAVGLAEVHNNYGLVGNEEAIRMEVHRERPDLVYSTPAYDAFLLTRAEHVIERHPLYYAKLVARRTILSTVGEYEFNWMHAGGESPVAYRVRTGGGLLSYVVNRPLYFLQSALQPAVFLLAMLALAFTWRGRRREHTLLIGFALATLVPYWLIHVETRYVLPASLAYLIWIGLGADLLAERVAAPARRGSARAAAA